MINDSIFTDNLSHLSSETYDDTIEKLIMVIDNYKNEYEKFQQDYISLASQYEELNNEKELNENENHLYIEELEQALTTLDCNYNITTHALSEKDAECAQLQLTLQAFQTLYEGTEENKSKQIQDYQKVLTTNQKLIEEIKQYKLQIEADEERMNQQYALVVDLKCQIKETNQQLASLERTYGSNRNNSYNQSDHTATDSHYNDEKHHASVQHQNYLQSNTDTIPDSINNATTNIKNISSETTQQKSKTAISHSPPPPMSIKDKDVYNLIQNIRQKHHQKQQQNGGNSATKNKTMRVGNNNDPMNSNSGKKVMPLKFSKPKSMVIDKNSDSWISSINSNDNRNSNNNYYYNGNNYNNITLTDFNESTSTTTTLKQSLHIKQQLSVRGNNNNNNTSKNNEDLFSTNELTNVFGQTTNDCGSSGREANKSKLFFTFTTTTRKPADSITSTATNTSATTTTTATSHPSKTNNNQRESMLSSSGMIATKIITPRRNNRLLFSGSGTSIGSLMSSPRRNTVHPEPSSSLQSLALQSDMNSNDYYQQQQPQSRSVMSEMRRAAVTTAAVTNESMPIHILQQPQRVARQQSRVTAEYDSCSSNSRSNSDSECEPETVSLKQYNRGVRMEGDNDEYYN